MQQIRSDLQFIDHYINVFKRSWGSYLFFFLGLICLLRQLLSPFLRF
ncbi:hypothetical protein V8V50_01900 [Ligilactobacillus salivarius]